ncbi:MAG: saccharopine dehydrogenase NADP-binding domain-containing protein [Acidimicrobiales bacterium]
MSSNRTVTVYGAYGHTGRFVVAELLARGWTPVLAGRSPDQLAALGADFPELEVRPAEVDSPTALDAALAGAAAVLNCAGPFAVTTGPVIEAALRARIAYLDVAAEIEAVADTFAHYGERARESGIVVVPAMAFYGGRGDLLATAAMGDRTAADEVCIAYALSSWAPTSGTRASSRMSRERRAGRRVLYADGRMQFRTDDAPLAEWDFPAPIGRQQVRTEFTMADSVTIPRHLVTPEIRTCMSDGAATDVANPELPPPSRESAQTFLVDVVVRSEGTEPRAVARGRDIYAISAPLVVEATERVLGGLVERTGVLAAGEAFDAESFLLALPLAELSLDRASRSRQGRQPGGRDPGDRRHPYVEDYRTRAELIDLGSCGSVPGPHDLVLDPTDRIASPDSTCPRLRGERQAGAGWPGITLFRRAGRSCMQLDGRAPDPGRC